MVESHRTQGADDVLTLSTAPLGHLIDRPAFVIVHRMRHIPHGCHLQIRRMTITVGVLLCAGFTPAADFPAAPDGTFSIAVIPDTQDYLIETKNARSAGDDLFKNTVFESYVD